MFKCKTCGKVYEGEECFSASADAIGDCRVFDGQEMRNQCPACGGMIYSMEEECRDEKEMVA